MVEYVKLGDIINYRKGFAFKSSSYTDNGTMVVRVSDFSKDSVSTNDAVFIEYKDKYRTYKLHTGDILIQTVGSWANNPNSIVGKVVRVPSACDNSVLNQNIVKIYPRDEKMNNTYLFYSLIANKFSLYCVQRGQGAANQASITLETIFKFKFRIHGNEIQNKIASILSTYDTLIENNTKRIRLLEKMAENLYKEWFVRFRFPGHENVKMVNGLPNGWKKGALSDVCEFKRGKNITSSEMKDGAIPVISAGITPSGFHSHANVYGISITMSSSGANAGYIAVHYSDIWAADCSYIEEASTPYIYYVYELLNNIRSIINNFQRGAAQPHVYPRDINRIKMIIPSEDIRKKANEKIGVIHCQINNLQRQNSLLARQRDLLLPRLMSGKLEV